MDLEGQMEPLGKNVSFLEVQTLFALLIVTSLCPEQCLLVERLNQFR